MFHPGLSVTLRFYVPFNKNLITKAIVTFKQDDYFIMAKTLTDQKTLLYYVDDGQSYILFKISQQLSLAFEPNILINADINIYSNTCLMYGELTVSRFTSLPIKIQCGQQYYYQLIE